MIMQLNQLRCNRSGRKWNVARMSKNSFTSKITEMRAIFDVERLFVRRFTRVIFFCITLSFNLRYVNLSWLLSLIIYIGYIFLTKRIVICCKISLVTWLVLHDTNGDLCRATKVSFLAMKPHYRVVHFKLKY